MPALRVAPDPGSRTRPAADRIGCQLMFVARRWRQVVDAELESYGLSHATWRPLLKLAGADAPLRQHELADQLQIGHPELVRLIDHLERKHLVVRHEVEGDRRVKRIRLTPDGRRLAARVDARIDAIERRILAGISTADRSRFRGVLARIGQSLAVLGVVAALGACGKDKDKAAAPPAAGPQGPVQVGVVTVAAQPVTLTKELPGRTSALRVAEVRARVNGIVQKRLFTEGTDVKQGQVLFVIDPAPYQAVLDSAQAQLARAQASVGSAQSLADRYATLIQSNAISRQEYENATSRLKIAQADVAAASAAVKTARINLDYTSVVAPIAGRIGRAEVTEGAYVQQAAATLMATVQQLDRVYVDVTVSSAEHARMKRALETGELQSSEGGAKVALVLEDGRVYAEPGALQFADVSVDPTTGSISLRAIFGNPRGELLPGMFVRARIEEGTNPKAILLAQKAVSRDPAGRPTALVVGKDRKAELRQLVTDRAVGDAWLVTSGLAPGEQVIVEGLQRVRPGADVSPAPAATAKTKEAGH